MSLSMNDIDNMIESAIFRLAGESGNSISTFYVDLRNYQQRVTEKLVSDCISLCNSRGIDAERQGSGLSIKVNLETCHLTPMQAKSFTDAVVFTQATYGNRLG
ncbi:hypothetical protein NKW55_14815 [Gluconobacter kondonii]|uniref:hypothetical protein n=1 Tax=Gluconobacter kondonii TaxID=941463 RepID=UPI0020A1AEB5|nr:hypothetical protein [Gluconobacter kondonii]MCP1237843.1 hypothetical protein [Gluconobacter kondonii]